MENYLVRGMARVRVDEQGRIYLPSELRREAELNRGDQADAHVEDGNLVIERAEPVAEEGRGAFESKPLSPEEIDEKAERYTSEEADA